MKENLKNAINEKLIKLFPGATIYEEDLPENYLRPSFLITTVSAVMGRSLGGRNSYQLSFDLSYYSNMGNQSNMDCYRTGMLLLEELLLSGYRLKSKKATTVQGVMHFTFETQFTVPDNEEEVLMGQKSLTTNLKED